MGLDSRLVLCPSMQELFRDKDTGLPLRSGYAEFYKDQARSTPKNVYKLSGSPPNYSYTDIGSVVNLTSIGSFSDNGNPANDIVPYLFPYEGTPEPDGSDGTVELYYVRVYNEDGVFQFSREAWPNLVTTEGSQQDLINYIPNGQFKVHTDIPASPNNTPYEAGEIRAATTYLTQGGWTFERPNGSTSKDFVTFKSFGDYVSNPSASPRYYAEIECESPSAGDAYKDLRIKFNDVNKFASDTDKYTFAFSGKSNTGSSLSVSLVLIKNYGTGGDTEEEIPLANLTITNSFSIIQKSGFVFGDNSGKTIGSDNDDFIQLALRFPTNSVFDVSITDFILTPGDVTVTDFPQTTDEDFIIKAIAGGITRPPYDSSKLYLPMKLTPQGVFFDDAEIGDVVDETQNSVYVNSLHPTSNRMLGDGSQYEVDNYSPLGIPYSRLWSKYWDSTNLYPRYGTGTNYLSAKLTDLAGSAQMIVFTNKPLSVTNTADGTPATTFTFNTLYSGNATYNLRGLFLGAGKFYIWNNLVGVPFGTNGAGTSGFTVTGLISDVIQRAVWEITPIAAAGLAGLYFQYSNTTTQYYIWFEVDGSGADPAPGGTGIKVKLLSTMTANDVGVAIWGAISGFQASLITAVAGSSVAPGSYFSIYADTEQYYVWYTVDGNGTDPAPVGKIPIKVAILSADTAAQVCTKTRQAINSKYFAVPDVRSMFLRGWDNGAGIDPNTDVRWSYNPFVYGDEMGTYQFYEIERHSHEFVDPAATTPGNTLGGGTDWEAGDAATLGTGGSETRPTNFNVNKAIIY